MPKLKRNAHDQETFVENANVSLVKKQRKNKNDKELSHGVHKNDSKKSGASNEKIKNTFTSKQNSKKKKYGSSNKFDAKGTEKLDSPTKYSRDDKQILEVSQKVQINTDGKTKHKMKNKNKSGANDVKKSDVPIKYLKNDNKTSEILEKTNSKAKNKKGNDEQKQNTMMQKKLERANKYAARIDNAKESIDFESKKMKIDKFKKLADKKLKRMSVETRGITLELNKFIMKIKEMEEMLAKNSEERHSLKSGMTHLTAAGYRYLNQMLHDNNSSQSKCYFKENPNAFKIYHMGYKWQLEQWAINPLDVIISSIMELPVDLMIADFGCGEARLAASIPNKVYSFDFVALNDRVKTCDMSHTSLRTKSIDVAVFCLSLMGSNLNDYIIEANRILKNNGILKIAEIENRFENVKNFIKHLRSYGFKSIWKHSSDPFYFLDFIKEKDINMKEKTLPPITLQSYLYTK
ncbi:ribosomal RNA-processing protein 8 [Solenopsis invicta]|uniref:ribosomal RNA-processing protein 8 n=1 Tax=Solenopsis invicta TaxID=13686 RepID=UPI000595F26A|nr:ribosomal RNA-processing protein 8 [Solenopsis invicta]